MTITGRTVTARALALSAAVVLGCALVVGCGSSGSEGSPAGAAPTSSSLSSSLSSVAGLSLVDSWVKAQPSDMTGFFGILKNDTDKDVTIVSGASPVAGMVEMHEMAMIDGVMKMRAKEGGFTVPVGGSLELKPGGFHVMLMNLKGPITAGQSVELTLRTNDGQEISATGVAKTIAGGNEDYAPSSGSMSPSMSMSASS